MQRQIVGQVFKSRSEQKDMAFAELLVEQQRRAICQPCRNTSLSWIHHRRVKDFYRSPATRVVPWIFLFKCGMTEVDLPNGCSAADANIVVCAPHFGAP